MGVQLRKLLVVMLVAILAAACTSGLPRESNLEKPRVLAISLAQPMLLPGQGTSARALVYDPAWRNADMHWVVALNPIATEAIKVDFGDPATLTTDMGFAYLGTGPVALIPPLPFPAGLTAALAQNFVEVLTLPLLLLVDIPGEERLHAFKNIRIQIQEGSAAYLEAEGLLRDLSEVERAAAIAARQQLVWNTNPIPSGLSVAALDREMTTEERTDLVLRKQLPLAADVLSVEPGHVVRLSYPLLDTDNAVAGGQLTVGDTGYNRLASRFYLESAFRIPLDTVTTDFTFDILDQDSAFDDAQFLPMAPGLYLGSVVGIDRRGGVVWEQFSVDLGSGPAGLPDADAFWLMRENWLQFWQPLTAPASRYMAAATQPVYLHGTLKLTTGLAGLAALQEDETMRVTAGVPVYLDAITYSTSAPATRTSLREIINAPSALHQYLGRDVTLELVPVRQHSP